MDEFVKEMLKNLNFESLLPLFEEQNIDKEVICDLNDEEIKELIPNLGMRKKVMLYLKKFQQQSNSADMKENCSNHSYSSLNKTSLLESNSFVMNPESSNTDLSTDCIALDSNTEILYAYELPAPSDEQVNISNNTEYQEANVLSRSINNDEIASSSKKQKIEYAYFTESINVLEFLKKNSIGRSILKMYGEQNSLDNRVRGDLVRLIVDGVLNRHNSITSQMALSIAEELVEIFPTETVGIYFYPAIDKKKNSGGKLLDRYRNLKKIYSKKKKTLEKSEEEEILINEELLYKASWLKRSDSPWCTVEEYWIETYALRKQLLSLNGPLSEFLIEWPLIKNKQGYALVSMQ